MHVLRRLAVAVLLGVSACSGNNSNDNAPPTSFSIGGTVQGVQLSGLVLRLNGQEDLPISSNGTYSFITELANGSSYTVALVSRPPYPNHTCALSNGTGTVTAADVTNIEVTCKVSFYLRSGETLATSTQLYVTDGTASGTMLLKDFAQFAAPRGPMIVAGDVTYFRSGDSELWRTDGTAVGTSLIKTFEPRSTWNLLYPTAMGSKIYFTGAENYEHALWTSDGTEAGTALVSTVNPYGDHFSNNDFVVAGNRLFFGGFISGSGTGFDLWKSDGTESGTVRVKDFDPGWPIRSTIDLAVLGDTVYFGVSHGGYGIELWRSDGTEAGTVLVKDINSGPADSNVRILAAVGENLFFLAADGINDGLGLWVTDGTEAGTRLLRTNMAGGAAGVVGNQLYYFRSFFDGTSSIEELWKSDGTAVGTQMVKDLNSGSHSGSPGSTAVVGQILYFYLLTPTYGAELWRSDGTDAGTFMVKDINPGTAHSFPGSFIVVGDTLYFLADDGVHGFELWKTDGTEVGTVMVTDLKPGSENGFSEILLGPGAGSSR